MTDFLTYLKGITDVMTKGPAPQIGRSSIRGFVISTVDTYDMGCETAIIDDTNTYIVERYDSEEEAQAGHARWVQTITDIVNFEIEIIDAFGDKETITLIPMSNEDAEQTVKPIEDHRSEF